jgi:glutaredoxin/glutathione-dependent peroxiredoxin
MGLDAADARPATPLPPVRRQPIQPRRAPCRAKENAMVIQVGETLPEATFMVAGEGGPEPKTTAEVFGGRTVALFAVPGAFTPTCSARHLPGFVEQAQALKAKGVDAVACTAVNDVFVMQAWAKSQDVGDKVQMLADGNGAFARAIGLDMDGTRFGMGPRSRRYSMVVKDGVVQQLNVEEGGAFEVSSADYLLAHL